MYVFKKNNILKCYIIEEDLNFKEKEIGGFRIFKLNKISNYYVIYKLFYNIKNFFVFRFEELFCLLMFNICIS